MRLNIRTAFPGLILAICLGVASQQASADIIISEVDPSGSGTKTYAQDWFELTNTGMSAVSLAGWSMDDSHDTAGVAALKLPTGVTSIGAGQSIVFLENTGDTSSAETATLDAAFEQAWFGSSVPSNLVIGNYNASNVGLSTSGDAVNIYNASNTVVADVTFGAVSGASTFDNTAGLNGVTLTTPSALGIDGAFKSAGGEIGSPGIDTAVSPVPLPSTLWLMLGALGGLVLVTRQKAGPVGQPQNC